MRFPEFKESLILDILDFQGKFEYAKIQQLLMNLFECRDEATLKTCLLQFLLATNRAGHKDLNEKLIHGLRPAVSQQLAHLFQVPTPFSLDSVMAQLTQSQHPVVRAYKQQPDRFDIKVEINKILQAKNNGMNIVLVIGRSNDQGIAVEEPNTFYCYLSPESKFNPAKANEALIPLTFEQFVTALIHNDNHNLSLFNTFLVEAQCLHYPMNDAIQLITHMYEYFGEKDQRSCAERGEYNQDYANHYLNGNPLYTYFARYEAMLTVLNTLADESGYTLITTLDSMLDEHGRILIKKNEKDIDYMIRLAQENIPTNSCHLESQFFLYIASFYANSVHPVSQTHPSNFAERENPGISQLFKSPSMITGAIHVDKNPTMNYGLPFHQKPQITLFERRNPSLDKVRKKLFD